MSNYSVFLIYDATGDWYDMIVLFSYVIIEYAGY